MKKQKECSGGFQTHERNGESSYTISSKIDTPNRVGIICGSMPCNIRDTEFAKIKQKYGNCVFDRFRVKHGYAVERGQIQNLQTQETARFAGFDQVKNFEKKFRKVWKGTCNYGTHRL